MASMASMASSLVALCKPKNEHRVSVPASLLKLWLGRSNLQAHSEWSVAQPTLPTPTSRGWTPACFKLRFLKAVRLGTRNSDGSEGFGCQSFTRDVDVGRIHVIFLDFWMGCTYSQKPKYIGEILTVVCKHSALGTVILPVYPSDPSDPSDPSCSSFCLLNVAGFFQRQKLFPFRFPVDQALPSSSRPPE